MESSGQSEVGQSDHDGPMSWLAIWNRVRSSMPEESPIDLEHHSKNIVQEVIRQEPEDVFFERRPVYERYLRRKHQMPLYPPTEEEKGDAIRILQTNWDDDINEEALRIFDEAGQ